MSCANVPRLILNDGVHSDCETLQHLMEVSKVVVKRMGLDVTFEFKYMF